MSHGLITAAILLAALASYALGMSSGALGLLVAGGVLELCFWARAFPGLGLLSKN
ncbi:hypothetical protein [Roseateles sp.]|uniref:hypothetical protein n=1 Tax=Roseateles sp. TaxID=1971397 RepID=UPI003263DF13